MEMIACATCTWWVAQKPVPKDNHVYGILQPVPEELIRGLKRNKKNRHELHNAFVSSSWQLTRERMLMSVIR